MERVIEKCFCVCVSLSVCLLTARVETGLPDTRPAFSTAHKEPCCPDSQTFIAFTSLFLPSGRSFVIQQIPSSNLFMVVVDNKCDCSMFEPITMNPVEIMYILH